MSKLKLVPYPKGPWYYYSGAVWDRPIGTGEEDDAVCILTRESNSALPPTKRDAALQAASLTPELIEALTRARDYLSAIPESAAGGDDEAVSIYKQADALLARVGVIGED